MLHSLSLIEHQHLLVTPDSPKEQVALFKLECERALCEAVAFDGVGVQEISSVAHKNFPLYYLPGLGPRKAGVVLSEVSKEQQRRVLKYRMRKLRDKLGGFDCGMGSKMLTFEQASAYTSK